MRRFLLLLVCLTAFLSCEKEPTVGDRYAASVKPPTILYIYGGAKYDVYLGKLNSSKFDTESIWNAYGAYGSKYRTNSIWNAYGTYGSEYNSNCPFNKYGSNPPALYDSSGKFYGYFTANKGKAQRAEYELIDIICENYKKIRDDVSDWYDKIFNNY